MLENLARMIGTNDTEPEDDPDESPEPDRPSGLDAAFEGSGGGTDDEGPDVGELDVRLDDLEDEIDSTGSSLRAVRSSQEEMADTVDEMNDTIRQLVGIYDRLAADDNPFVDDAGGGATTAEFEFGGQAVGETPTANDAADEEPERDGDPDDRRETDHGTDGRREDGDEAEPAPSDDPVVSFEDLRRTNGERHADEEPDGEGTSRPDPTDGDPAAASDESPRPDGADRAGADGLGTASTRSTADGEGAPVLASVPDGYAGDVLLMEWLGQLLQRSGDAGAVRAIEHYEDSGLISTEVREYLLDVVGGPSPEASVEPTEPREPTTDEHALSYGYLRALSRLTES